MLRRLRRWLGWDADSGPFDFGSLEIPERPKTAVAPPPKPAPTATPSAPRAARPASKAADSAPKDAGATEGSRVLDILDDPKLTLDRPKDDGFDPYNTGAFNRSASWERISRHKR
jgi:hypothetical protein